MATRRKGKPYIHVTWLAKLLGGNECLWSAWFKAHHKYDKYETQAVDLVQWNRDHSELMRKRRLELEREGYRVMVEQENDFKLELEHAIVAGKPDIVATKPGLILLVDGKTGRERESDIWQVLLYLRALPKVRPELTGELEGEVQYKRGDTRIAVSPSELTDDRLRRINDTIKTIASDAPPRRVPSRFECQTCNIGRADCPQRIDQSAQADTVAVSGLF